MDIDEVTERIIGCAIKIHKALGPGLLESAYGECLCYEMARAGLTFQRQVACPIRYEDVRLNCGYRIDLLVEGIVIVELKAVDALLSIHEAQLLTHLRLADLRAGLLINFNVLLLKDGIRRMVNRL